MVTNRDWRVIARRALYCGIACQLALLIGLALDSLRVYELGGALWDTKPADVAFAALPAIGICAGTALTLRKPRMVLLAIAVGLVIGFVDELVAKQVLWMLSPTDAAVELAGLGPIIDRHYSIIYGFTGGELAGGFLASLLVGLFCSSLQGEWRAIVGGFVGGLVVSALVLLVSIWATRGPSPGVLFVWPAMVFSFFVYGFAMGGGIGIGERLGARILRPREL